MTVDIYESQLKWKYPLIQSTSTDAHVAASLENYQSISYVKLGNFKNSFISLGSMRKLLRGFRPSYEQLATTKKDFIVR